MGFRDAQSPVMPAVFSPTQFDRLFDAAKRAGQLLQDDLPDSRDERSVALSARYIAAIFVVTTAMSIELIRPAPDATAEFLAMRSSSAGYKTLLPLFGIFCACTLPRTDPTSLELSACSTRATDPTIVPDSVSSEVGRLLWSKHVAQSARLDVTFMHVVPRCMWCKKKGWRILIIICWTAAGWLIIIIVFSLGTYGPGAVNEQERVEALAEVLSTILLTNMPLDRSEKCAVTRSALSIPSTRCCHISSLCSPSGSGFNFFARRTGEVSASTPDCAVTLLTARASGR